MNDANPPQRLPRHVAIIMDGNGRWARHRGLPRPMGHREGARAVRRVVEACHRRGIEALTLFAFSSENWRRPSGEVNLLLELFMNTLRAETERLHRNNVRLRLIGERSAFPARLRRSIAHAEDLTAGNDGLDLVVAANYGGRWDILQAVRQLLATGCTPQALTEERLAAHLSLAELPEPDLFIRTGGEQRLSNFLLWQLAYSELHFTPRLWPDFAEADLDAALADYARRQRRFGMTAEQVGCPDDA